MKTRFARRGGIALVVVVTVMVTVAAAWAVIPGENGVIQGCYDRNGNVKVVDALPCPKDWKSLPWSQSGPQGPPGEIGQPGTQGPPGPTSFFFSSTVDGVLAGTPTPWPVQGYARAEQHPIIPFLLSPSVATTASNIRVQLSSPAAADGVYITLSLGPGTRFDCAIPSGQSVCTSDGPFTVAANSQMAWLIYAVEAAQVDDVYTTFVLTVN